MKKNIFITGMKKNELDEDQQYIEQFLSFIVRPGSYEFDNNHHALSPKTDSPLLRTVLSDEMGNVSAGLSSYESPCSTKIKHECMGVPVVGGTCGSGPAVPQNVSSGEDEIEFNEEVGKILTKFVGRHNFGGYNFDQKELEMGRDVEMEHIPDFIPEPWKSSLAFSIARDHLSELPDYYTRLKIMELEGENEKLEREQEKQSAISKAMAEINDRM
jgi:hypothetical protein